MRYDFGELFATDFIISLGVVPPVSRLPIHAKADHGAMSQFAYGIMCLKTKL